MKKNIGIKQPGEYFNYCGKAEIYKDIYVYVIYTDFEESYEMKILIPEDKSVTGIDIHICCFYYDGENFEKGEKDAKMLIKNLIK